MKRVFNNAQLAHVWAQQSQLEGRGSNFFFEGPTLYSYGRHFIVGRFIKSRTGAPVVLLNNTRRSNSTSKHQAYARRAISPDVAVFHVPRPDASRESDHLINLGAYVQDIDAAMLRAARARKYAEGHLHSARCRWAEARSYADAFGLPFTRREPHGDDLASVLHANCERLAAEADERARVRQLLAEQYAERAQRWRAGENVTCGGGPVMLRLSADTLEVQTSMGARVPTRHAMMIWDAVRHCYETGLAWEPERDSRPQLGEFRLDRIAADGTVLAGCHVIYFAEVAAIADALGLEPATRRAAA